MGFKLSKLFKHTYVVSEGVQTDLSIQSCDEVIDCNSFITPPRDVQHLCDPRSITRGIVRTPIVCQIHEEMFSPVKEMKKPYLETNLDEVPFEEPGNQKDNVIDASQLYTQPSYCNAANYLNFESNLTSVDPVAPCPSGYQNSIYEIEILEKSHLEEMNCSESLETDRRINIDDFRADSFADNEIITTTESKNKHVSTSHPILIDSSETVQHVCQKILEELLSESSSNVIRDKPNDSEEEIFVDGDISNIVKSMKKLCINGSSTSPSLVDMKKKITLDEHVRTPDSQKCILMSPYENHSVHTIEDPSQDFKSMKKVRRQPLKEVNRNIQSTRPQFSNIIMNADIENSSLKLKLPLISSQVPPSVTKTKPHRSTWDTENTLII